MNDVPPCPQCQTSANTGWAATDGRSDVWVCRTCHTRWETPIPQEGG